MQGVNIIYHLTDDGTISALVKFEVPVNEGVKFEVPVNEGVLPVMLESYLIKVLSTEDNNIFWVCWM